MYLSRHRPTESNQRLWLDQSDFARVAETDPIPHIPNLPRLERKEGYKAVNSARDFASGMEMNTGQNRAMYKLIGIFQQYPILIRGEGISFSQAMKECSMDVCDMCGGPGSWSRLMLDHTKSRVHGVTIKTDGVLDWYDDVRRRENFTYTYADIVSEWEKVLALGQRFDLVVGDGGTSDNDPVVQTNNRHSIMFYQAYLSCSILKQGGNMVVKMYYPTSEITCGIVREMLSCFREVSPVKPVMSRSTSSEFYLVCLDKVKSPALYNGIQYSLSTPKGQYLLFAQTMSSDKYIATDNARLYMEGKFSNPLSFSPCPVFQALFDLEGH